MTLQTHRSIGGGQLRFSSDDHSHEPTGYIEYNLGNRTIFFQSGPRSWGRAIANDRQILDLDETYTLSGGQLVVGSVEDVLVTTEDEPHVNAAPSRRTIAIWEGTAFCLWTELFDVDSSDVLSIFDRFEVAEYSDGVTVTPIDPSVTLGKEASFLKEVPQVGVLFIRQLTEHELTHLPVWSGTQLQNGELFHDHDASGAGYYKLVTGSTVAVVLGAADRSDDPDGGAEFISRLDRMVLDWIPEERVREAL